MHTETASELFPISHCYSLAASTPLLIIAVELQFIDAIYP